MITQAAQPPVGSSNTRRDFLGALLAAGAVVAFCLLLLWHDPLLFWNDDYEISILPVFADVARSWSEGHWPLLSPYSWVCSNLAGEFQYGTFSVFVNAAVVLIWKFPLIFSQQAAALSMLHLFVLGCGGYFLARGRNLSAPLATMVAFVAAPNGWIMCWAATDWFGALGAFAWLPWAWWAMERALDPRRSRWRFLWPAPFVYLLITGGFPYTVLMLALLTAWLALKSLGETGKIISVLPLVFGSLLGLGLSAPAWLALLDYTQGSLRQTLPSSAHFQWRVPAAALPGFILPSWTVNWADFSTRLVPHAATEMGSGLAAPVLLIMGLIARSRLLVRRIGWELALLGVVLLFSMLPSANVFRWSFRWLPFLHLILAVCAADAFQACIGAPGDRGLTIIFRRIQSEAVLRRFVFAPGAWALLLVGLTTSAMFFLHANGRYSWPFTGIILIVAGVWAALVLLPPRFANVHRWMPAIVTFIVLLATYLCIPPNCGVPKYNFGQELLHSEPLDPVRLYLSIYPPPELAYRSAEKTGPVGKLVRPGSTPMWAALRFVNGYSPIRAAGVASEFAAAIHGEIDPATAAYLLGWQAHRDGGLAKLGVDGIVIANELEMRPSPADEWTLIYLSEEGRVYHRRGPPLGPIQSLASADSRPNEQFAPPAITLIENPRNRAVADVSVPKNGGRALIAFSRPYFRGYQATIGERRLEVNSYHGLMPVVEVPPGTNGRLILNYRPWWLTWGAGVAFFSLVSLLLSLGAAFVRRVPQ